MSTPAVHAHNGSARNPDGAAELSVVVECHGFLCALSVSCVTRLAPPDDVSAVASTGGRAVEAGGEVLAAWDLGKLLGLAPLSGAWLLMSIPFQNRNVAIALRTGACLVVERVRPQLGFPAAAFRARASAFLGAFDVAKLQSKKDVSAAFGIVIDPTRLLDRSELEASRSLIEQATHSRTGA